MRLKNKVFFLLFIASLSLFLLLFFKTYFDISSASEHNAKAQAKATAQTLEAAMTAHMISGTMDQRDQLLKQLEGEKDIKKVWLVRSRLVVDQYGKGIYSEEARDGIDQSVLESGEEAMQVKGGILEDSTVRLSYPYKAKKDGKLNCMSCHNVKENDTLGVISIELITNDYKQLALESLAINLLMFIAMFAAVIYFFRKTFLPYVEKVEQYETSAALASRGDFSQLQEQEDSSVRSLLEKLQKGLEEIASKLSSVITLKTDGDVLAALQEGTNRLSQIDTFAKTIRSDDGMKEVYTHLQMLVNRFTQCEDVNLIEYNPLSQETDVVYTQKTIMCDAQSGCRAARTMESVDSTTSIEGICPKMMDPNVHYVCLPYSVTETSTIVLSMVSDQKEDVIRYKSKSALINDFVHGSINDLINQKLKERLKKLERHDSLTGLYNRNFLDDRMVQVMKETKRVAVPYGMLMINIDNMQWVNTTYGEKIGDETLRLASRYLVENLRETDTVVREKGDQFIVLLYDCTEEGVVGVGERLCEQFAKKKIKSHPNGIIRTLSIGAIAYPSQCENLTEAIEMVRIAMSTSKTQGGNKTTIFSPELYRE